MRPPNLPHLRPRWGRVLVLLAALAAAPFLTVAPAAACPSCAVGRQARAEVWNEDFGYNLVVALLPFALIGAICVRVEAIGRGGGAS